jgi:4-diphosphocytidyl-2-C-methyl-D-erythritol kinase
LSARRETAFAKLNLALHVRGRRSDGRHQLETLFAFCEGGDELRVEPDDALSCDVSGVGGDDLISGDNLVLRAACALRAAGGTKSGARLQLTKRLPIASGIGGGSADAAAALRLLVDLWDIDPAFAGEVAPRLGADVPACLISRTCRGTGVGDELVIVDIPGLSETNVLLVNPRVPLGTAEVFERWEGIDRGPLGDWRTGRNDLESAARTLVPQISLILSWLDAQPGASFVRMSGSGATCFALFDDEEARDRAASAVPREWWHLATRLR